MRTRDLRGLGAPGEGKWNPAKSPRSFPLGVPGGEFASAIMIHQMGCVLGTSARQRAAAGGDRELARALRCVRAPYHAAALCATGEPQVLLVHDPAAYTYHGNRANGWTVALGVEGRYPLEESGRLARHTAPQGSQAREALFAAAPATLRALADLLPRPIALVTHRQSSGDRRADPGEIVLVALAPAIRDLGIVALPDLVLDDGAPWPSAWLEALDARPPSE